MRLTSLLLAALVAAQGCGATQPTVRDQEQYIQIVKQSQTKYGPRSTTYYFTPARRLVKTNTQFKRKIRGLLLDCSMRAFYDPLERILDAETTCYPLVSQEGDDSLERAAFNFSYHFFYYEDGSRQQTSLSNISPNKYDCNKGLCDYYVSITATLTDTSGRNLKKLEGMLLEDGLVVTAKLSTYKPDQQKPNLVVDLDYVTFGHVSSNSRYNDPLVRFDKDAELKYVGRSSIPPDVK